MDQCVKEGLGRIEILGGVDEKKGGGGVDM